MARLSYFNNGPGLVKEYLEKHGIHLVTLSHLRRTYLDGAVLSPTGKNPVIGLTLRYDRIDNFWFCILHELAHLGAHDDDIIKGAIIDDLDLRKYNDEKEDVKEKLADKLAQEALIPESFWGKSNINEDRLPDLQQIFDFAESLSIHPAIIAGRIRYETNNYRKYTHILGHGTIRKQFEAFS